MYFVVCIALMLFPMCIYWDRDIITSFKKILKDPNVNLIMEQIELQCLRSEKPKDASTTS